MVSGVILGIDLGTTNTVVAATRNGKTQVLKDAQGRALQPSVVSYHPSGEVLAGLAAKDRRAIDPRNTLFSIKRLIGRGIHARETKEMIARMPFEIVEGERQSVRIKTRAGSFAAAEVSAVVLDHIKKLAETALGHPVSDAVITVPASFSEAQRAATSAAGTIAGLNVLRIINEPTAAAVAFGYQKGLDDIVAVYDFGGGTFDISILKIKGEHFEVLSSAGDSFLGGDDIDERIVSRMTSEFLAKHQLDLRTDAMALQRLYEVAEKLKVDLTRRTRCVAKIDEIAYREGGKALDLHIALTRSELEEMSGDLIRRTFPVCDEALHQAGLRAEQISALVLVGGTTGMPLVREMAAKYFQSTPRSDVHPDEAIAIGAALQGEALRMLKRPPSGPGRVTQPGMGAITVPIKDTAQGVKKNTKALMYTLAETNTQTDTLTQAENFIQNEGSVEVITGEVTITRQQPRTEVDEPTKETIERGPRASPPPALPLPPGSATAINARTKAGLGQALKVERATALPVSPESITSDLFDESPTLSRDPAFSGVFAAPVISEVTSQALGIATISGFCEHLIKRNTPIPGHAVRVFSTSRDGQESVRLRVCQGNARLFADNTELGDLVLNGIAPAPRGRTQIEVTFRIDVSGRLQVTARDPATGKEQHAELSIIGTQSSAEQSAAAERLRALRNT